MIVLDHRDPRPIYEQVVAGFQRLLESGALQPGDKLPSVRELAGMLTINPNTIQRAYRELEARGLIYSISGKGSFAADAAELRSARIAALLEQFDRTAEELRALGVSGETLAGRLDEKGGNQE